MLSSVLLPDPLGPTTTTNSPGEHVRLTPRSAGTDEPSKFLSIPRRTSFPPLVALAAGGVAVMPGLLLMCGARATVTVSRLASPSAERCAAPTCRRARLASAAPSRSEEH